MDLKELGVNAMNFIDSFQSRALVNAACVPQAMELIQYFMIFCAFRNLVKEILEKEGDKLNVYFRTDDEIKVGTLYILPRLSL